jgi:hypothetical protein
MRQVADSSPELMSNVWSRTAATDNCGKTFFPATCEASRRGTIRQARTGSNCLSGLCPFRKVHYERHEGARRVSKFPNRPPRLHDSPQNEGKDKSANAVANDREWDQSMELPESS